MLTGAGCGHRLWEEDECPGPSHADCRRLLPRLRRGGDRCVTAGAVQRPGETRIDLINRKVGIFDSNIKQVAQYIQEAILLIATNPVDILTQVALKLSG